MTHLQYPVFVFQIQKIVFPRIGRPLLRLVLLMMRGMYPAMVDGAFVVRQNVRQTGVNGFGGEGQSVSALFDGVKDVQDFGVAVPFQLSNAAS